jgi:hypothetical protein
MFLPKKIVECLKENSKKLILKKSLIKNAGTGVFAKKDIAKNVPVTAYSGWIITKEQAKVLESKNYTSHLASVDNHLVIMGVENIAELNEFSAEDRGLGSFINHHFSPTKRNCKLVRKYNSVYVVSLRYIVTGEELYVNYGRNFNFETGTKNSVTKIIFRQQFKMNPTKTDRPYTLVNP